MSRLRDALVERYAEHYARVNTDVNPLSVTSKALGGMEQTFGPALYGLPAGAPILDLGCGTGFLLRWLTQRGTKKVVGVDASRSQVELLRQHLHDAEVHCAEGIEFLRARPAEFAAIFCTDVLEHIPDDSLLDWVEAARAALCPGGRFVVRVPNAASIKASYSRYMDLTHCRSYTSHSLTQLFTAAGFTDCRVLPLRLGHLSGRVRLSVEYLLHRAIFRICGNSEEHVFTSNIHFVGVRS